VELLVPEPALGWPLPEPELLALDWVAPAVEWTVLVWVAAWPDEEAF
jgi:hypothetical protein